MVDLPNLKPSQTIADSFNNIIFVVLKIFTSTKNIF